MKVTLTLGEYVQLDLRHQTDNTETNMTLKEIIITFTQIYKLWNLDCDSGNKIFVI